MAVWLSLIAPAAGVGGVGAGVEGFPRPFVFEVLLDILAGAQGAPHVPGAGGGWCTTVV